MLEFAYDNPAAELMIVADEWDPMHALASSLTSSGLVVVHAVEEQALPADLAPYDAVVMYIHRVMDVKVEQALIRYGLQGGRLIILHHGLASAKLQNPQWMQFTGMHLEPRDALQHAWRVIGGVTHTLVNLNPWHYITSHRVAYPRKIEYQPSEALSMPGVFPALDLPDTEVFLNQQFTDGREKTVLFGTHCVDPETNRPVMQDRGGWYRPAGDGWIFYLQPGHSEADFHNAAYCQIILNCITWRPNH